jgi:hypothetical protein
MTKTPKFTKKDLDKLLNCSDQLQSTFKTFRVAIKRLNDEREKVKKQRKGLIPTRGAAYHHEKKNKKALNKANNVIDDLVKEFSVSISDIDKNIGIVNSQDVYKDRLNDLISYYKKNISDDKMEIQRESSDKALANRLSYYYMQNDSSVEQFKSYLMMFYWALVIVCIVMLIYNGLNMPSVLGGLKAAFSLVKSDVGKKVDVMKKDIERVEQAKKIKNPLSDMQIRQILGGPGRRARISAINPPRQFGGSGYSLQPWLTVLMILLGTKLAIEVVNYLK